MHRIIFFRKDGSEIASVPWDMGLLKAKKHAKYYMKVHNAAAVSVFDDTNKVVYQATNTENAE